MEIPVLGFQDRGWKNQLDFYLNTGPPKYKLPNILYWLGIFFKKIEIKKIREIMALMIFFLSAALIAQNSPEFKIHVRNGAQDTSVY